MILETKRLILRPWRMEDAGDLCTATPQDDLYLPLMKETRKGYTQRLTHQQWEADKA